MSDLLDVDANLPSAKCGPTRLMSDGDQNSETIKSETNTIVSNSLNTKTLNHLMRPTDHM